MENLDVVTPAIPTIGAASRGSVPLTLDAAEPAPPTSAVRRHIRGSTLLLVGRSISLALNFAVQILTVRYLAKTDYGAFAYAIGVTSLVTMAVQFGLGKAAARLVPIYYEQGNHPRAFGHITLVAVTIWGLGLTVVLMLHAFQALIGRSLVTDPQSLSLLLILIALPPLEASDSVLQPLVAVFASPRAIFLKRQVLSPALKLATVLLVILTTGSVYLLAYGYVLGTLVGECYYVATLVRRWRRAGLLQYLRPGRLELPVRELFGFALPFLSSEILLVLRGSLAVVLLGQFWRTADVAEFRAVLPVSGLNTLVFECFGLLFVPVASRMFARRDVAGIRDLYWQTSVWIAVLTFPIFIATCSLAEPLTVALFGPSYSSAGTVLAILAVGEFINAAVGFNAATLRVHGTIRIIVTNDVIAALLAILLSLFLIPRYGTVGAALSVTATLVIQNALNTLGLWLTRTGIHVLEWRVARVYVTLLLATLGLLVFEWLVAAPASVRAALAAVVSLVVIRLTAKSLRAEATFPELLRIGLVRRVLT
jgi:O-antigen/teichoic acid export membrane protein